MAYKKKKSDMSREELENRVEWLSVELKRMDDRYAALAEKHEDLHTKYYSLPRWVRAWAEMMNRRQTK